MVNGSYTIYTDGCCLKNPGPGGIGICLSFPENLNIPDENTYRGFHVTTNNRMELRAGIIGLRTLRDKIKKHGFYPLTWFTDSKYVVENIYNVPRWRMGSKWTREGGEPVLNADLWKELWAVSSSIRISPQWVSREENKCADKLAKQAAKSPTHTDFGFNPGRVGFSIGRRRQAPVFFEEEKMDLQIRIYKGDGQISRADSRCKIRFQIIENCVAKEDKYYIYVPINIYANLHRHHAYAVETREGEILRIIKEIKLKELNYESRKK